MIEQFKFYLLQMFDYVDIVFIDGDGNLLPWLRKCEKVKFDSDKCLQLRILFKMCKMTNKCLFAAGIGMQFLVYYCATNLAELNVINGKEKGGPITAIKEV